MTVINFQFSNPRLIKLNFDFFTDFIPKSNQVTIKSSYRIEERRSADSDKAGVTLIFTLNPEKKHDVPFTLTASIFAVFNWHDLDKSQVDKLLKVNAPALLLSYLRPIIANITANSGMAPYTIPFINFTANNTL